MLATLGGYKEVVEMMLQISQPDLSITTKVLKEAMFVLAGSRKNYHASNI